MSLLSGKVWWAVQISSFWRNWGILQTRIDRSNEFENKFKVFSNSEMNLTSRYSRKSRWKKWSHLCSFHVPFLSYDPKIAEKSAFLNFVLTSAKKSKYVRAIYIYASETSRYVLSENVIVYYAMTSCVEDISIWNWRALLNFCRVSMVFDILIANISWTMAQTPIHHIIFWKTVMKIFRFIYVNCFNRLGFLAEVSSKLQKMHVFGQFKG